jgi:subtilisin family serine protease
VINEIISIPTRLNNTTELREAVMNLQNPGLKFALCALAAAALSACGGGAEPAAEAPERQISSANRAAAAVQSPAAEVIVMLKAGVAVQPIADQHGLLVLDQFGRRPIYRLGLSAGVEVDAMLERLLNTDGVEAAERNAVQEAPVANASSVWAIASSVWAIGGDAGAYRAQWAPAVLGLAEAHTRSRGEGVRIAVLDTGADLSHPELAPRWARSASGFILGRDFVDDDTDPSEVGGGGDAGWGHGTHVAGLAALTAPAATLMPVRVLDRGGRGNTWVLAEALGWTLDPDGNPATDDGAHVVNLSLGTVQPTRILQKVVDLMTCNIDDDDDETQAAFPDDVARCSAGHSAVVLAAAGNNASADLKIYPAAEEGKGMRAVAASTAAGRLADFSNRGGWVKLAAPGEAMLSTVPGGTWGTWSGTSMAAPIASGVAALVMGTASPNPRTGARHPLRTWHSEDVLKRLEDRATPLCGASLKQIHAAAAVLDREAPALSCSPAN